MNQGLLYPSITPIFLISALLVTVNLARTTTIQLSIASLATFAFACVTCMSPHLEANVIAVTDAAYYIIGEALANTFEEWRPDIIHAREFYVACQKTHIEKGDMLDPNLSLIGRSIKATKPVWSPLRPSFFAECPPCGPMEPFKEPVFGFALTYGDI